MRTSKVFVGVAMASLLAACSNDLLENAPVAEQSGRPTVNAVLSFEEQQTRLAWGQVDGGYSWTFDEGDRIGALLMDTWDEVDCGYGHFAPTDYVHTNYSFLKTVENGKSIWRTPENAAVSEGNYFFYFPYQPAFTHRGYVGFAINPAQKNYDPATGEYFEMQSVKDNQRWLGYHFIGHANPSATGEYVNKVNFDFDPLFATPKFVFENKAGVDLKVERLVVRAGSKGPAERPELLSTSIMLAPKTGNFDDVWEKTWEAKDYTWHTANMWQKLIKTLDQKATQPTYADGSSTIMSPMPATKVYNLNTTNGTPETLNDAKGTYEYTVDFGDKYYVKNFGDVVGRLVMPGGAYMRGEAYKTLEAVLYVQEPNSGKRYAVRVDLDAPKTNGYTNNTGSYNHKNGWDDITAAAADKFMKPGITPIYMASFDATAMQSYAITDWKVVTSQDLEWVVTEGAKTGVYDLGVTTIGEDVEMTKAVYDFLKANKQVRLQIDGTITLGKDLPADAVNMLHFHNDPLHTNLIIAGTQVKEKEFDVDPVMVDGEEVVNPWKNVTINVLAGASLDTKKNGVNVVGNVANAGTVTAARISGKVENAKGATLTADRIDRGPVVNEGTLTVTDLRRGAELTNKAGAVANVNNSTADVENAGTLNAMGGKFSNNTVTNTGVVNVKGVTSMVDLQNKPAGVVNVTANAEINGENQGTINVTGAKLTPLATAGTKNLTNAYKAGRRGYTGTIIVNDGELMYVNGSTVENYGLIDVNGKSHVMVSKGTGIIDVTNCDQAGSYQAKSDAADTYFMFKIEEGTPITEEWMKRVISSNNLKGGLDNPIIFNFVSDTKQLINTGELNSYNIAKIKVDNKATVAICSKFPKLTDAVNPATGLGDTFEAIEVTAGATMEVPNTYIFTDGCTATAVINGKFRAENNTKILGTITVNGAGTVENATLDDNWNWKKGSTFTGKWSSSKE